MGDLSRDNGMERKGTGIMMATIKLRQEKRPHVATLFEACPKCFNGDLVLDARAAGLAAAGTVYAVNRRAILPAVAAAAVAAALVRALA